MFEWSTRRTPNPAVKVRIPSWSLAGFGPRLSRVQILGHACKQQTSCFLSVGVFLLCFIWFVSNYLSGVLVNKLNKINTLSPISKLLVLNFGSL